MSFFKKISERFPEGKVTLTIVTKNGKQTVGFFPEDEPMLTIKGTPDELDCEFFSAIAKYEEAVSGIKTNIAEIEKTLKEKESNLSKEASKRTDKAAADAKTENKRLKKVIDKNKKEDDKSEDDDSSDQETPEHQEEQLSLLEE